MDVDAFLEEGAILSLDKKNVVVGIEKKRRFSEPEGDGLFYFQQFFLQDPFPWFRYQTHLTLSLEEFKEQLEKCAGRAPWLTWEPLSSRSFFSGFETLQEKISKNELSKGVPYAIEKAKGAITPSAIASSLAHAAKMATQYPLFLYGKWEKGEGILGATPELLFRYEKRVLQTVACAGTFSEKEKAPLQNTKLLEEHRIVVDALIAALSPFGRVTCAPLSLIHLKKISHLLTPIEAILSERPLYSSFVKALHPTPALGAYPKRAGEEWLNMLDQEEARKAFGAPVGYLENEEKGLSYVAIRNMQWRGPQVELAAGCGVIKESNKEEEWQEIQLKLKAIKELLQLPIRT